MIKIYNDFNTREGDWEVVLNERFTPPEALVEGTRVIIVCEVSFECEAIVRHGKVWPWIGDVVAGTVRYYSESAPKDAASKK
jgi:hypothetical protein